MREDSIVGTMGEDRRNNMVRDYVVEMQLQIVHISGEFQKRPYHPEIIFD